MTVKGREHQLRSANNFAHVIVSSDENVKVSLSEFGDFNELNRRARYFTAKCDVYFGTSDPKEGSFVKSTEHTYVAEQKVMWEQFVIDLRNHVRAVCGASQVDFVISAKILLRNTTKGG